ncbi:MAG: RdgB/HAM1 family non-canonical purine NTP pyrophosphatase [Alphaproteobacteria bacterium]
MVSQVARRLDPKQRLVIASHNDGKVREIRALLAPYGMNVVDAGSLGLPEPEETGDSFVANAELKSRAAAAQGEVVLADDSGLAVAALDGDPGIYSARWAGPGRDFAKAMALVEEKLAGKADRRAWFVSVLSLAWPDGHVQNYEGRVMGRLTWPPRGKQGFGYDPMFIADGYDITFGEMEPDKKHAISHRAVAFAALIADCLAGDDGGAQS